ncbi:hypothetical protein JOF56_003163 [Kibdelosporangium banguiense]|uniref:PE domain-containing protein n=1 Tax=Kibdelosporangium banguiense TaxID=1365924 RepID=A0ABS4TFY6_9PSEU|nr:transcriptional regulator [Kibdelosporangium banguiense]MBP2322778.1 hypothetical protein [Kibdelosporangium banguiense]
MAEEGFQFDPQVLPRLHSAFADALAKVDRQIELARSELRVTAWAGDSVSGYAHTRFNARSLDGEANALQALEDYREALNTLVVKLHKGAGDYRDSEDDKHATMNQQGEG